ncbi:MAG: LuxR C-terminal-related transcriptional regulator [Bacteroidia bacterium]
MSNEKIILQPLTKQELQTLLLLLKGLNAQEVADQEYGGRINMVETHTRNIRAKANAKSLLAAAFRYIEAGMIPGELLASAFEGDWQKG